MENIFLYFLIANVVAFVVTGYDKHLAVYNKFRIPEKTLFTIAFCGGSVGMLIAMIAFRHKIRKASFIIKFATIALIQLALLFGFTDKI